MRPLRLLAVLALAVSIPAMVALGAQTTPAIEMRKAVELEKVTGDTAKAIEIYRRLAGSSDTEISRQASEALARLGATRESAQTAAVRPPSGPRQVWERRGFVPTWGAGSGVSPDGTFLTFTDWRTGNLVRRDLATGDNRPLTKDARYPDANYAVPGPVSPDGSLVAYSWVWVGNSKPTQLRLIGRDGGEPRTVWTNTQNFDSAEIADWAPDGKALLVAANRDRSRVLMWIPVSGGEATIVKRFDTLQAQSFRLAANGRTVAYRDRLETG